MDKQVIWECSLPMKKGQFDNDYIFYNDGTIEHYYDCSVKKFNIKEEIQYQDISERDRIAILDKIGECPVEWKNKIMDLLG